MVVGCMMVRDECRESRAVSLFLHAGPCCTLFECVEGMFQVLILQGQ